MNLTKGQMVTSWVLQLLAAGILLQTLYFKFTGAEESVYIFTAVGAEPWGRIGSGVVELIAAVLLLAPGTTTAGAIIAAGVMAGAVRFMFQPGEPLSGFAFPRGSEIRMPPMPLKRRSPKQSTQA